MTSQQLTTTLRIAAAALAILVIGVVSLFAYNVYVDREAAKLSTPALRVLASYEDIVRQQPNVAAFRVRLGEAYAAAGRYQDAIEQFNAAIKLEENHTGAYLDLGLVAMINDHVSEAIGYFEKVVEITDASEMRFTDARRELALFNLGKIALDDDEYEDAVGYFKEALRVRRDSSDTYLLMARAYDGLGDTASALKYVEYALAFDPNFAQANYQAGEWYLREKDYLKASEHIRKAIDAAPEERAPAELLEKLGTAESWAGKATAQLESDPKKALEYIKIARRIDPFDAELALLHGRVLEKVKKPSDALVTYREALELDTENAEVKAAIKRLESSETTKTKK